MSNKCKVIHTDGVVGVFNSDDTPSILFEQAIEYYKDQDQALKIWELSYSNEFKDEVGISPENVRLNDILEYLSGKSIEDTSLTDKELSEVIQFMEYNGIESLDKLSQKLNSVFKPNGYFEVSTRAMVSSGLWTQQEAEEINPKEILNIINKITSTNLSNLGEVYIVPKTKGVTVFDTQGEKTILGTYKTISLEDIATYAMINSPSTNVVDIKDTLANSERYSYVSDKMADSPTLTSEIMSIINSNMVIPKAFVNGDTITTENLSDFNTIENVVLAGVTSPELEADIDFLDSISSEVWAQNKSKIERVVKKIENRLIDYNIDIIGLSEISELDREGTLVLLESALNVIENPSIDAISRFSEVRVELLGEIRSSNIVLPNNVNLQGLNIFHIDTLQSDSQMLEKFNMLRVGDSIFHAIDINIDEAYQTMYEMFQEGSLPIPVEFITTDNPLLAENINSVMESLKNFVKSRNVGFDTNNQEIASIAQILFNYSQPSQYLAPSVIIENSDYLMSEFITDFYQHILIEKSKGTELYDKVLKHFYVSETDINLNSISLPDITGMKYEKELREYATLKKQGQIKQLSNLDSSITEVDIQAINYPETITELQGSNFIEAEEYIVSEPNVNMYVRIGENTYRKVYSDLKGDVYKVLSIPKNNIYFLTELNFETSIEEAKSLLNKTTIPQSPINSDQIQRQSTIDNRIKEHTLSTLTIESLIQQLIDNGEVDYTNEEGLPCAKLGMIFGENSKGKWRIVEDLKGMPSHSRGGVDLEFSEEGVTILRDGGNVKIKAQDGLVIPPVVDTYTPTPVKDMYSMGLEQLRTLHPNDIYALQTDYYNRAYKDKSYDHTTVGDFKYTLTPSERERWLQDSEKRSGSTLRYYTDVKDVVVPLNPDGTPNFNSDTFYVYPNKPKAPDATTISAWTNTRDTQNPQAEISTPSYLHPTTGERLDPNIYITPPEGTQIDIQVSQPYLLNSLRRDVVAQKEQESQSMNLNKELTSKLTEEEIIEIRNRKITPSQYFNEIGIPISDILAR